MCPRENLQSSEVLQYYKLPICAASAFLEFNENARMLCRNYFKAYIEIKQDSVFIQEYPTCLKTEYTGYCQTVLRQRIFLRVS